MPSAHWAWTLDVSPRKSPACGRHWAPHPEDRHAVLVHHTEHGRATARALRDEYDQGAARLFEGLHLGDLAAFTSTVDHLIARHVGAAIPTKACRQH